MGEGGRRGEEGKMEAGFVTSVMLVLLLFWSYLFVVGLLFLLQNGSRFNNLLLLQLLLMMGVHLLGSSSSSQA